MEFKVIKRNGSAVVPDGMFKLCGMENAKLISMVQLNGGILLMPESVSTFELITLIDALTGQACEFLEALAAECGPAEEDQEGLAPADILSEFEIVLPDWLRKHAGIAEDAKLECDPVEEDGKITLCKASYQHDLTDVPYPILQYFLDFGYDLYTLNEMLVAESQVRDDADE